MKSGTEYELFVKDVYKALNAEQGITSNIELHKVIVGTSGAKHEIDLYWEFKYEGKVYKTSIECKDHKREITKGLITEYYGKLHDLPELHGIVTTKVGYQKGACSFANHYDIDLLLVKKPQTNDFDEDIVLKIEITLIIESGSYNNVNFDFDLDWIKGKYPGLKKFHINGSGETTKIKDETRNFQGTVNQFINLKEIREETVRNLSNGKANVRINFDDAQLIDSIAQKEYKIKAMTYDYVQNVTTEKIDIDALTMVKAIVKRVKNGEIIFIQK